MKLLQINKLYHPVIGGIETIVKIIAEGLNNQDNLQVAVLACQKKGPRITEEINGVQVIKTASFGKALGMPLSFDFFKAFFQIKKDYDLFLLHYPFPLASLISLFIPKEKLIILYHSDIVRQKIGRLPFLPFINSSLKRAKKIIVSGHNIINSSPSLKKQAHKCVVIPFGLNFSFSPEDYTEAEKIKTDRQNSFILLGVGRLVYYKGFEYVIRAMTEIEAKLLIIGQGPEEKKLRSLINELNLQDKVEIIPPQDKLAPYFLACDAFVFPSCARSEAFGLVQLEALAAAKPIINTYLKTAVEEVSLNKETGFTVPIKNIDALREAINKIITDKILKEEFSKKARQRYLDLFTEEKFLEKIKNELK